MTSSPRQLGAGRLLIAVYAVFAVSATARASFQIVRKFTEAPLAYSLSAMSALIYLVATIALAKRGLEKLALIAVSFELLGVIVVGALSYIHEELFAHPSVWSHFGQGYGYIPLVLPVAGLFWLRKKSIK